ncbi:MAG: hypothetical protein ACRDQ9_04975 [Pseudonocardiaceae bacterium]
MPTDDISVDPPTVDIHVELSWPRSLSLVGGAGLSAMGKAGALLDGKLIGR